MTFALPKSYKNLTLIFRMYYNDMHRGLNCSTAKERNLSMQLSFKAYKKDFDHSYALGVFLTIELLMHKPEKALCILLSTQAERNSGVVKMMRLSQAKGIPVEINDKAIERLSPKENCYAIGVFRKYETALDPDKNHIVLVNPMDPGNLGTIIRTSLGFGFGNLAIIKPAVDIFDPKSIRASMGALFSMDFSYYDQFNHYAERFSSHRHYPFLLNGKIPLHQVEDIKKEPYSLIFGNESSGLPQEFQGVGTGITIPHAKTIDSLNLSVAVAIAEYEFTKGFHA